MKRIRDKTKHLRRQAARERSELEDRRARRQYLLRKRRGQVGVLAAHRRQYLPHRLPAPRGFATAVAPRVLSLVHNPEPTIVFLERLHALLRSRKPVVVSLKNVEQIHYDGVVVLLAVMISFKAAGVGFTGDMPRDSAVAAVLRKSKFFSVLRQSFIESDRYTIAGDGAFHTHANRSVDAKLSAELIAEASQTVFGETRRCQGAQRVFIELMHNTNNHASLKKKGEKHWWVSVNHQPKKKRVTFSFVDFGVGIFESLDNKGFDSEWHAWRHKAGMLISNLNNAEILKLVLDGALHQSVTKAYYRGKGLPGIREVVRRGGVSNLVIITNHVYANVSKDEYRLLKTSFSGTLVHWEINQTTTSSPNI